MFRTITPGEMENAHKTPNDSWSETDSSQLPAEILCQIFEELSKGPLCDWVVVTHVCRRWRDIALNLPSLWTHLDGQLGSSWMEEMSLRSNGRPLSLSVVQKSSRDIPSDVLKFLHKALKTEISRLKEIVITTSDKPLYIPWPLPTAPCLEALTLGLKNPCYYLPPELPKQMFHSTPNLRKLHLRFFSIPWTSNIFDGLTDLHLELDRAGLTPLFTDALPRMPALRYLYLRSMARSHELPVSEPPIPLPYLENLDVGGSHIEFPTHILSCIRIPTSARVTLLARLGTEACVEALTSAWLSAPLSKLPHLNQLHPSGFGLCDPEKWRETRVLGWNLDFELQSVSSMKYDSQRSGSAPLNTITDCQTQTKFSIVLPCAPTSMNPLFLYKLPIDQLAWIEMRGPLQVRRNFWEEAAPYLLALKEVRLCRSVASEFVIFLQTDPGLLKSTGNNDIYLPSLQTVKLTAWSASEIYQRTDAVKILTATLRHRLRRGTKLRRIEIHGETGDMGLIPLVEEGFWDEPVHFTWKNI